MDLAALCFLSIVPSTVTEAGGGEVFGVSADAMLDVITFQTERTAFLIHGEKRDVCVRMKRSRIYYLTHIGAIPHHKVGQTLFFREDEILKWMEGNRVTP